MRTIAVAGLAMATLAAPASADTPAEAAVRWGLPGVWKLDCARGPSRADVSFRYIVRGGQLQQERDDGTAREASLVSYAEIGADGMLELTILVAPPARPQTLALKRENDSQFLVWSNRATGTEQYTVRNGKYADGSSARPLLTQCSRYGDK